jgi:hypothetical protein
MTRRLETVSSYCRLLQTHAMKRSIHIAVLQMDAYPAPSPSASEHVSFAETE